MDDRARAFEADATTKKPIDEQIQSIFTYVQQHEVVLDKIHQLNCRQILQRGGDENHLHAIKFLPETIERVAPQDLLPQHVADPLKKTLIVLIFLGEEISQLKEIAENKFYRPLTVFGTLPIENFDNSKYDEDTKNNNFQQYAIYDTDLVGVKEKIMGHFLPTLQELANFIERCNLVVLNFIQQLSSLYHPMNVLYRTLFEKTHLMALMNCLNDLLTVLITLDCIILNNENLSSHWSAFKSMVAFSRSDPDSFQTNMEAIIKFESLLVSLDQKVFSGEIFKNCIEQNFEEIKLHILAESDQTDPSNQPQYLKLRDNEKFLDGELLHCLKVSIENAMTVIGTNGENNEKATVIGALGMYALYRNLLPRSKQPDPKLFKTIWSIQKSLPCIIITDNVMFNIGEFLVKHIQNDPALFKKLDPVSPEAARQQYLERSDAGFETKSALLISQCKAWMILAESRIQPSLSHETTPLQTIEMYGTILIKGLSLAKKVNYMAKSCLIMHSHLQIPLNKTILMETTSLLEILKAMEFTFKRKDSIITEFLILLFRNLSNAMMTLLQPLQFKLEGLRNLDVSKGYLLAVIKSLIYLVKTTEYFTPPRLLTVSILLEIILNSAHLASYRSDKDSNKLTLLLNKISVLSNLNQEIMSTMNTAFMFFHTDILQPIVSSIYHLPTECARLHYIFAIFEDGIHCCNAIQYEKPDLIVTNFVSNYRNFMKNILKTEIIQPLSRDIETDLRLHIHTKHLDHMSSLNPKTENLKIRKLFLDLFPIRILGILISIKDEITHYLDMNFYNLTTIALHDWRTYSEMRSLAFEKYGVALMDNFLPMGSLDQGLDVLQIMRNIHIFVSRFTYNMNMQQFIEYRPDKASKHINTIKIQSIAASVRQHGLGMLNTTVNFTYQFLSMKFKIFSQFLFDEHIRSPLSKEHRWFRKNKNNAEVNNIYPYDRASGIVKEIRKLGVNEGKTFLDQFRILVTEIGNALGYVRMVRSASMYYCSEAVKYLPDFEEIIEFEKYTGTGDSSEGIKGANLSGETVRAAKNLDDVIKTLVKNFGEGSDYFKVLVSVFQTVLSASEQDHLKYFYIIGKCSVLFF
jgi:WASH complex subunit 7